MLLNLSDAANKTRNKVNICLFPPPSLLFPLPPPHLPIFSFPFLSHPFYKQKCYLTTAWVYSITFFNFDREKKNRKKKW